MNSLKPKVATIDALQRVAKLVKQPKLRHADNLKPKPSTIVGFPKSRTGTHHHKQYFFKHLPLPLKFPEGINSKAEYHESLSKPEAPCADKDAKLFPYKYYKITLTRGLIGLPHKTKKHVESLGLLKRFKTVYRVVHPINAGLILKVKELVQVQLVNSIPGRVTFPKGYKKISEENK